MEIQGKEKDIAFSELVNKAREEDKESIEEIIKRLQPLIISSIRKYYNNYKEYEDLVQDGNLMILQSIKDYDHTRGVHFLGYIKTNLRFLYLDKHKRKHHMSLNEPIGDGESEIIDLLVSEDMDILDMLIENERNDMLKKSLDILTDRQKQVIIYFYVNRMSIDDIAKNLGISYRTVVNTKTRAIEKLKQ